ncbi:hypothetical protein, partial [Streptomyces sp. NPDC051994]|uniref:hypothetical protein n=1 Tax=Streptomyces sp. NPDC051994 TaxID=3155287 RepID=UPI00341F2468
ALIPPQGRTVVANMEEGLARAPGARAIGRAPTGSCHAGTYCQTDRRERAMIPTKGKRLDS